MEPNKKGHLHHSVQALPAPTKPRLMDQMGDRIRSKHYSVRTEHAYLGWVRRFILFTDKRHPAGLGAAEVERFLSHLAVEGNVSASTQNQALAAILFLYKEVLAQPLPWLDGLMRAKKPERLPTVLTVNETQAVLSSMEGTAGLMARLLYGTGMRLMECVRLRVKDVDFGMSQIVVRDGKGYKDRVTMLPQSLIEPLHAQLTKARRRTRRMWRRAAARCICRMRSRANIRPRAASGAGNTYSLRVTSHAIRVPGRDVAITWTRNHCNAL